MDQCARRDVELRPEVVQAPAQVVDQRRPLTDEPLAVVDQQPHVALGPGELSDGQRVEPFTDRGARDRDGVDRVGLAALARGFPRAGHQLRRHAHNALTAREQEPLQRAGDVPTILDRPHALFPEPAPPPQQILERLTLGLHGALRDLAAHRLVDRRDECATPCACPPRARPSPPGPLRWDYLTTDRRWTHLSRGDATLLSGHAGDPRTAAGDTTTDSRHGNKVTSERAKRIGGERKE